MTVYSFNKLHSVGKDTFSFPDPSVSFETLTPEHPDNNSTLIISSNKKALV